MSCGDHVGVKTIISLEGNEILTPKTNSSERFDFGKNVNCVGRTDYDSKAENTKDVRVSIEGKDKDGLEGDLRNPSFHQEVKAETKPFPNAYCKVCGVPSKSFCKSCGSTFYCSKEHQKADWKKHKKQCIPVTAIGNGESGRKLIATRDIKQGELILTEAPILITPNTRDPYGFTCLGCCNKVQAENIVTCSKCGWALCSSRCENEELHAENECKIFTENGIQPTYKNVNLYQKYCEIGVLRMLLVKNNNPERWSQLTMLDNFVEYRKLTPDTIFNLNDMISFIQQDCKLPFSEEVIDIAFGILRANSFDSSDYSGFVQNSNLGLKQASLIFPTALIPGQSCVPNGHYVISGRQNGNYKLSLIAAIGIYMGQSISVPYEDGFSGTFLRQEVKRKVFFQNCECERCKDSTELGTFLSSSKCLSCKNGYYIQPNPLEKESDWKCTDCSTQILHTEMIDNMQTARVKLYGCLSAASVQDSFKELKDLKGRILHPNNFLILQTEIEICRRILTAIGMNEINNIRSNTSYADILIEMTKHLLSIADIVRPGFNRTRGRLLYCLQYGLVLKLLENNPFHNKRPGCPGRHIDKLVSFRKNKIDECKRVQKEAEQALQFETEDSLEEQNMSNTLKGDLRLTLMALENE